MTPLLIARFSIGPIGSAAIGLATVPLLAWIFPPEALGRLAMLQLATTFCLLFFGLGLEQACVREYHQSKDRVGLFKISILPGLILLTMSIGAVAVWSPHSISRFLFGYSDSNLQNYIYCCLLGAFILRFLSLVVRLEERGMAFSMTQLLPKILFLCFIVAYYFSGVPLEFSSLLVAQAFGVVTSAFIFLLITRSSILVKLPRTDWSIFRRQISFGLPLVISGLGFWGMTSIDRLSLRHFSDFQELGVYSVAISFAGVALVVQSVFQTIWTPMVFRWHSEGVEAGTIHRMTSKVLGIAVLFISLAGLLSWCVELVLPESFHASQFLLPACLVVPLFFTLSETAGIGLGITRRNSLAMTASLIALCLSIFANALLVPFFGAAGASSATALSFLTLLVLRTEFANSVWIPMPRLHLYLLTTITTCICICYALFGASHRILFSYLWAGLLLSTLFWLRKDIRQALLWLEERRIQSFKQQ